MYRVQFEDFRCFGKAAPIEVRPITLLIGENSAGKTSFLAGLRFALESFTPGAVNPFNRDPYFLGGFEQIAHIGGRRGTNAKSFEIAIRALTAEHDKFGPEHRFTFVKGGAQPQFNGYGHSFEGVRFRMLKNMEEPEFSAYENDREISLPKEFNDYITGFYMLADPWLDIALFPSVFSHAVRKLRESSLQNVGARSAVHGGIGYWDRLAVSVAESTDFFSHKVFSSAPVRSHPLRTYTPSEVVASSEGAHVPLALSRAKAGKSEDWAELREGLVGFGQRAGLFKDIDVKSFGKGDADPFQIMVKVAGTSMNLADVGYGVSQVLPILYQVQKASDYKTFLLQQPEVHLHPRAQAELGSLFVSAVGRKKRQKPVFVIETHSDYLVDRVRIEVANGKISPNDVTIVFFDRQNQESTATNLYLNDRGEIQNPPDNFRDFFLEEHAKLLGF